MLSQKQLSQVREGDVVLEQGCSFDEGVWTEKTTDDYFKGKRVVLFSLPGAFTPTCTSNQLPGFENNYESIKGMNVDEVYCCPVNDTFVMNAWAEVLGIQKRKSNSDGSWKLYKIYGYVNWKNPRGFGNRSGDICV